MESLSTWVKVDHMEGNLWIFLKWLQLLKIVYMLMINSEKSFKEARTQKITQNLGNWKCGKNYNESVLLFFQFS